MIRFELLRRKISQRELERRYDWGHGYLSNVLAGRLDLKLKTLFQVLRAFEMEPEAFFHLVKKAELIHGDAPVPKDADPLVEPDKMERLFDLMVEAGKVAQELRDRRPEEEYEPRKSAGGSSGG